jgi:putative transposase
VELQERVHQEVVKSKERSGWPARRTLAALGIPYRSYYRWLKEKRWQQGRSEPVKPVQPYEATAQEKEAVLAYARAHQELRHREMAWRMVDEDVVCLSASTVYRILKEADFVCPWRRRSKRKREEHEKASRPDQRWGTDLMYLEVGGRFYYYVGFLDEYSRYLVHFELLRSMDGASVSLAAQGAIERLPRDEQGQLLARPEIRSDNGSGYLSKEFRQVLQEHGLCHVKIKPHCPEENGLMERSNRTVREAWEQEVPPEDVESATRLLRRIQRWYNEDRLHSALGYLRPVDYYRRNPEALKEERRLKLAQARHRRKQINLGLQQPVLPLAT